VGKYVHFSEVYKGENGDLDMDYWVLDYNLEKAKTQFLDAPKMMKAFEYWFGPYPFYKDGYKLVDAPHLGMEHQSATAYGNGYKNGYLGRDLSGSGWGLKWDFIIIHESGHEWFGNNITTQDIADMWVHEGFTNYSETLFTEFYYGKAAATDYVTGIRKNISNDKPIIGPYHVNKEGSGDMYYKAANMIHTIRQIINDDSLFRKILRGLNSTFYHQTVTSKQVENYISDQSKINFNKVFDQYLRTIQIPELEYRVEQNKLFYRYTNCIKGFEMPVKTMDHPGFWIKPTEQWQMVKLNPDSISDFSVDPNFYINTKKVD
jgi:aminopeptidase N